MMAGAPIILPVDVARRFHRRAVGLDAPHASVGAAIAHHGYVQIDPINVCGRMHDLILRNRTANYTEGDLMRHVHGKNAAGIAPGKRVAFEHHLPGRGILVAFGNEAWPYLRGAMRDRRTRVNAWWGKLDAEQERMAKRVLAEIAERGPLSSDDIEHGDRSVDAWGTGGRLARTTLDRLFFHGRVLIARRNGGAGGGVVGTRRVYDLPERVLPAKVLAMPEPGVEEAARWLVLLKLRQHRLVMLKKSEVALVEDAVRAVKVEGVAGMLYILREDVALLENKEEKRRDAASTLLLAPLDPLIYDRRLTSRLWGFDYTWEVYVPQAKRVRGYYALPALAGVEFVGHVDPKADRARKKLAVIGRSLRRRHKAGDAIRELARFLGLE